MAKAARRSKRLPVKTFTDLQLDAGLIPEEEQVPDAYRVDGIIFGSAGWSPEREGDWIDGQGVYTIGHGSKHCPVCGGDAGPVQPGSSLYCAACHRSGVDHRIYVDFGIKRAARCRKGHNGRGRRGRANVDPATESDD